MREIVLARRALFVASTLHTVGVHAQGTPPNPSDANRPAIDHGDPWNPPPVPAEVDPDRASGAPHHIPGVAQYTVEIDMFPRVCLSIRERPRRDSDAIDLAVGVAPQGLYPIEQESPTGAGVACTLGLRRDFGRVIELTLLGTAMPSVSSKGGDGFAPIGGVLRLGVSALTPGDWDSRSRLVTALEVGAGTWLGPSAAGMTQDSFVTTRGPWASIGMTPIALRYGMNRDHAAGRSYEQAFEVGVPIGIFMSTLRSADSDVFRPAYVSIGVNLTFYLQVVSP